MDCAGPEFVGHVGVVTRLIHRAGLEQGDYGALLCGPELMMRFSGGARLAGLRPDRLWVSMERNMQCGIGLCGHCQFGPTLVCRDGPVFRRGQLAPWLGVEGL